MIPSSITPSGRVPGGATLRAWALAAAVGLGGAQAQTPAAPGSAERLAQVADSYVAQQGFSGSVLVARGDTVLLSRGYGMASHEWAVPNAPDVKYLLASVSKQFTAAAVLRLADQGRLQLDDPVIRHLPETPPAWRAVTVRQLLAHTGGIPTHTEGEAFEQLKQQAHTPRQLMARFSNKPLEFTPGTAFRYSNSGYVMLGLLVEQLSGKPWGDFIGQELLAPLGLRDSGVASNARITPRLASGYVRERRQPTARLLPAGFLHLSVPYSAGAMYGTTGDLLKWQRGLYGGRVLSAAALKEMTTPLRQDYALGLNVTRVNGRLQYGHSGGITGFSTYLLYDPQAELSVVVLGNIEGAPAEAFARRLAAFANGQVVKLPEEIRAVALPAPALAAVQGAYRLGERHTLWVMPSEGALWARLNHSSWTRLVAESALSFVAPDEGAELRFQAGADGRAETVTLSDGAGPQSGRRVELPAPSLGAQPLYLRGSMNDWSVRDRLVAGSDGQHRVTLELVAGEHQLKVATEDWRTVDLGEAGQEAPLPQAGPLPLAVAGGNIALRLPEPSRCRFELDGRDIVKPLLRVACQAR
jgi:CubicO group peptidase (beta-lactamase class C family)